MILKCFLFSYYLHRTIIYQTELEIAGQKFQVSFPVTVSAAAAGQDFCVRNAAVLALTDETVMNCINPVTEYFQKVINEQKQQLSVDVVTVCSHYFHT